MDRRLRGTSKESETPLCCEKAVRITKERTQVMIRAAFRWCFSEGLALRLF